MLLLIDIDEELADLFDEDGDYASIADSLTQASFGINSAEVILVDDMATSLGITLKRRLSLEHVMPKLKESLEQIRRQLRQTSVIRVFGR